MIRKPLHFDRRRFIAGAATLAAAPVVITSAHAQDGTPPTQEVPAPPVAAEVPPAPPVARPPVDLNLYVGTYNGASSKGIHQLTYRAPEDDWSLYVSVPEAENVSYGVYSTKHNMHYMLNEQADGKVMAFRRTGIDWQKLGEVSSQGNSPCYIALSPKQDLIAVANYMTGNLVLFPLDAQSGLPLEPAAVLQNKGKGPVVERQEGPHAHCVQFSPDGEYVYCVDLGSDQIVGYRYDAASRTASKPFTAFKAPPGSGPRHMVYRPDGLMAYMVAELSNKVFVLKPAKNGKFEGVQTYTTLPTGYLDPSQAGHLAISKDGTRLYASNRGHNSLAIYAIAKDDGFLTRLAVTPTEGDWPRFFSLHEDQNRLLVAHQKNDAINIFTLNPDGTITTRGQSLTVERAVFIGQA